MDLARNGYRFEHSFAFYPLMPVVTGFLARNFASFLSFVSGMTGWGGYDGSVDPGLMVGVGIVVSAFSFVAMAVLLYVHHAPTQVLGFILSTHGDAGTCLH